MRYSYVAFIYLDCRRYCHSRPGIRCFCLQEQCTIASQETLTFHPLTSNLTCVIATTFLQRTFRSTKGHLHFALTNKSCLQSCHDQARQESQRPIWEVAADFAYLKGKWPSSQAALEVSIATSLLLLQRLIVNRNWCGNV